MTDEKPAWWRKNEELKQSLGIPEYQPPRFTDSVYTYHAVKRLEEKHGCTIRFVGLNSKYPDDWHVQVDGELMMTIGRHRDENGNSVFEMESDRFERALDELLTDSSV